MTENSFSMPNMDEKQLKLQSEKMKQQCKNYTQSLRLLLLKSKKFLLLDSKNENESENSSLWMKKTSSNRNVLNSFHLNGSPTISSRNPLRRTKSHELHGVVGLSRDSSFGSADLDSSLRVDDQFDDMVCCFLLS